MPVIKFNGQQFALQPGPNRLGGGTTADMAIADASAGLQAVVDLAADGRAIIHSGGAQTSIKVNGMALAQPTPLIHGDKVEIGGKEMYFADDAKGGSTQFVSAAEVAAFAGKRAAPSARATMATGGRLVSLVDGKEYAVPEAGVVIGRDASADIVVAQTSVSRRHAQVIPATNGYVVNDLSTNGLHVNGEKVNGTQSLNRADVIRVGTEEFRFYADLAPVAKPSLGTTPSTPAKPVVPLPAAPPVAAAPPAAAAPPKPSAPTLPPRPATPAVDAVPTEPRPVTPPPPATAKAPPPAPVPAAMKPAAAKPVASTPPARPATPVAPPPAPEREQVTTKNGVPKWALVLVVVAILAVVAYFFVPRS